jgi:hypothetical protein
MLKLIHANATLPNADRGRLAAKVVTSGLTSA